MTHISFIVCTYDRYDIVGLALHSIVNALQSVEKSAEILLVDNTPPAKRQSIEVPDGVEVLPCDKPGLAVARNFGISATAGDIVVFIDDDAEVRSGYVAALLAGFSDAPEAEVIGGRTDAVFPLGKPSWFSDELLGYLSCVNWGPDLHPLKKGEFIVGANIAFRRSVFSRYGGFNENLGRIGTSSLLSNEESELLSRLKPGSIWYNPRQVVGHHIPRERLTQAWFRKRIVWQAISDILGGLRWMNNSDALEVFGEIQAAIDPSERGLGFLMHDVDDPTVFSKKMRLIYALIMLSADGFDEKSMF